MPRSKEGRDLAPRRISLRGQTLLKAMENAGETPEEAERAGAGYARDAGRHN